MSEAIKNLLYASDKKELEVGEAQEDVGQSVDVEGISDGENTKDYWVGIFLDCKSLACWFEKL